ncbi:MAG TPA: acetate kinase, partial [Desulfocapsa sulfexigens]|nr:acetate kinase [Desulfocapsa sulfexigens]
MKILVLNAGSSSLKFQLFNMLNLSVLASGVIEQIGEDTGNAKLTYFDDTGARREADVSKSFSDHRSAIQLMIKL